MPINLIRYDITNVTSGIMILPDTPIMHKIKLIQLNTEFKEIKKSLSINMLPYLINVSFIIT